MCVLARAIFFVGINNVPSAAQPPPGRPLRARPPVQSLQDVPTHAPSDGALMHSHSSQSKHKGSVAKPKALEIDVLFDDDYRGSSAEAGPCLRCPSTRDGG